MTTQHTSALTNPAERTPSWADPTVRALRRAQPPPSGWRTTTGSERRFWAYLAAAAMLAALVLITAAIGVNLAHSGGARLILALVIPAVAALAVHASAAAACQVATPRKSRRQRRSHC